MVGAFLLGGAHAWSQTLPASVNTSVTPPYSVYLGDYLSTESDKFRVIVRFNDMNEPSWDVKLRFTIQSNDIVIKTRPDFTPAIPITLTPGVPMILTNIDLAEYFNFNNLTFSGITPAQLNQNGRLPENLYSFCFEVLDYRSGKPISIPGCANVWAMMKEPPYVLLPQAGAVIAPSTPQNIPFTWQMANAVGPGDAFSNEYQLTVYEVTDRAVEPLNAINNGKALKVYTSEWTTLTTFLYDIGASLLDVGKRYVFTVQVRDINGRNFFKNDGFSQVGWFDYGYPQNGLIQLSEPLNNAAAALNRPTQFKWSIPNNLIAGQRFKYTLTVVGIGEGQDERVAMELNTPFATYTTPEMASSFDVLHLLERPLEPMKQYAWQVRAYSGEQTIASSEIFKLSGPPVLEKFMAGNQEILVKSTENADLTNLRGIALVKISQEPDALPLEIPFSGLRIRRTSIQYVLDDGQILHDLSIPPLELNPEKDENQTALFYPEKIRITKNDFSLQGNIKWSFPHAVVSGERAYVKSESKWFNFSGYKLKGLAVLSANNTFELLDPYQFTLAFDQTSDFEVIDNVYRLHLNGNMILPANIKGQQNARVSIPFLLKDQLYYFSVSGLNLTNNIVPMTGSTISIRPKTVVFDLSDKQSPLKLMATSTWKGLYFENFDIIFPQQLDASHQLTLTEAVSQNFKLDVASTTKAWVAGTGLTCVFNHTFLSTNTGKFNTFPGVMKSAAFKMIDGSISDSEMKGAIKIPVVDDSQDFVYTIPLADNGFQTGYLDQSLEERSFIFNPYGVENKVELVIKRAIFSDNERLDFTVDISIPYIHALLTSVSDFRAYGDYGIGFGKRNGGIHLDHQVEADYDGFTMFIDQVAASFINGNYAFSYSATMPLGEEVAGNEGPPRVNIHSVESGGAIAQVPYDPDVPVEADIPPPTDAGADNGVLKFDSVYISISSAIVDLTGYLKVTKDDPKWGTSFQGGINGSIKIPTQIDAGANLILGDKDNVKYWYFDAWFLDHQGMGLPVFNMFNMVAFEGKVYRHMELDLSVPSNGSTPNLIVNPEVQFGAGLYMQLVDKTGGKKFMSDIGAEVVVRDQGFIVSMEGDISAINDNGRNTALAGQVRQQALKQAAAEAAKQVVEQLGEISIDIPLGGGDILGVKASGQGGGLSYTSGDMHVGVEAQVADVPGGTVSFSSGSKEITVSGNADAHASLLLKDGSNQLGLNIEGRNGGALNLTYDAFQVETAFNKAAGSASLLFRYGDKLIDVAANKTDGNGHLALQYGERKRMYLALDRAGKGEFELQYDDNLVGISGDSETGSGALRLEIAGNTVAVEANKSEGTGSLLVQSGEKLLSINASRAGAGALRLTDGEKLFAVQADKTAGTGQLELKFASDKRMFLAADRAGKGEMEFEYGSKFFRIAADKTIGMGELRLRDGADKYFNVYVNKSENVGNIGFRYGQDSVMAMMDGDTSAIAFVLQNKRMGVGVHRAGKGGLVLQDGQRLFEIMADKTQGAGSLRLEDGPTKRIFVSANKSQGTGTLDIAYDNNSLLAEISPDRGALSFDINNTAFNVSASRDGAGALGFRHGDRSFDVAISGNSGTFSLDDGDRHLSLDADKTLRFKDGTREIVLSASDPTNSSIRDGNRTIALTPDETGARSYTTRINSVDVTFRVGPAGKTISFSRTGTAFEIGVGAEGYGKINLTINGATYSALQENSNTFTLSDGHRSLTVSGDKTLMFREGPTKSVSISTTEVALVYDGRNLSFGKEKYISYSDSDRSFDLGADGLSITEGSKSLSLTSDKQLILKDGTTRSLSISAAQLVLQNEGMEIALGSDKSLRYSDADRSFTLNTQGVEIIQGDKSMALLNSDAGLGLQLKDGTRILSFSRNQVTLAEGDNSFTLGGEQYLALAYQGKNIAVGDGFISYEEGDRKIAFGGENFVELKDGDRLLAITKEKVFTLADGDKAVSIGADKTFSITDGTRTIALGGTESIVRYSDNENTIAVQASGGTYGFSIARPEITVSASTEQFRNATLSVATSFGSISITGDASKNIDATFAKDGRSITITGGAKGPSLKDSAEPETPEAELTEVGTQAPDMAGPQYIGKVTDDARGGRVKGNIRFYYNSIESHLIANASVASVIPPCLTGALTVESRGDYWRIDIGSEQQMIRVFPSCSGFGGGGWLGIDPQNLSVGVFAGFSAGGEIKIDFGIGWAKIGAKVEAELGIRAKAQLEPQFVINEAGVWVRLYAGLYVKYDVGLDSGSITIAEAELKGTLTFYFTNGTRMVGTLAGRIEVIGIGAGFDMGFDQSF